MKTTNYILKLILPAFLLLCVYVSKGQESNVYNLIRDGLLVYYVEDPMSDQYRLIDPEQITSGQPLFGGNPNMNIAQAMVRDIFAPESDNGFQQSVVSAIRPNNKPMALFLYNDRGPLEEAVAKANWTSCFENKYFTSCVTVESDDEFARIVHYGANQITSDGIAQARMRLISLLNASETSSLDILPAIEDGITLTFYTGFVNQSSSFTENAHREFEKYAKQFSREHNAISVIGNDIVLGEQAAIPVMTVAEIVEKSQEVITKLRDIYGHKSIYVNTIAIMTHGLNDYINFGNANIIAINEPLARQKNRDNPPDSYETAETFADALEPILDDQAKIVLYACLAGSTITADQWRNDPAQTLTRRIDEEIANGADGAFGRVLRDFLNDNGKQRQVWAHRTQAHTTGNPAWRVFKGAAINGPLFDDLPFINPSKFCSGNARGQLANRIKERLNSQNISVGDNRDFEVWVAMEIPFAADNFWPLLSQEPTGVLSRVEFQYADGLVEWYANRWVSQNSNIP